MGGKFANRKNIVKKSECKDENNLPSGMEFDFEKSIRTFISGMIDERRWNIYTPIGISYENVLMHHFKQTLQIILMVQIELQHGNPWGLDIHRLMMAAPTHDMPEGHGEYEDLNYHVKRENPELRAKYKQKEKELFGKMMLEMFGKEGSELIPVSLDMDKQASMVDKVYWEACEHVSHLMFILEELTLGRLTSLEQIDNFERDVVFEHTSWYLRYAYHFPSVRFMHEKQILPKWAAYREKKKKGEL